MLAIAPCEREPRHRVHQDGLAQARALARQALAVDRRLHVHERQRHELGEAAGALLQPPDVQQVPRPVLIAFDMAEHDGGGGPQARAVRGLHHIEPLAGGELLRA